MKGKSFKNSISIKLASTIGIILIIFGVFCIINVMQIKKIDQSYNNLLNRRELVIGNVQHLQYLMTDMEATVEHVMLTNNRELESKYYTLKEQFDETLANFEATSPNAKSQEQIDLLKENYEAYVYVLEEGLNRKLDPNQVVDFFDEVGFQHKQKDFHEQASNILQIANNVMAADRQSTQEKTNVIVTSIIIAIVVFLLVGAALGYVLGRNLAKPINILANRMQQLADGNFALEPLTTKQRDEIGLLTRSSNMMLEQVKSMFQDVQQSANEISLSTASIAESSDNARDIASNVSNIAQTSAKNSEHQLRQFEQAHEQMIKASAEVKMIAQESNDMQITNAHTLELSREGEQVISNVLTNMEEIKMSSQSITSIAERLENYSKNADHMLSLITTISEQTNLLALNASIEAARAGDAGKGFAVVADEVRNLAEESRKSVDQVREVVGFIHQGTADLTKTVQNSHDHVLTGMGTCLNAKTIFSQLLDSINALTITTTQISQSISGVRDIHEILGTTIQQSKVISNETQNTAQETTAIAQEQLAISEQLSNSIRHFNEIAEILVKNVERFKA